MINGLCQKKNISMLSIKDEEMLTLLISFLGVLKSLTSMSRPTNTIVSKQNCVRLKWFTKKFANTGTIYTWIQIRQLSFTVWPCVLDI